MTMTDRGAVWRDERSWLARSYVARHWHGELSLPVSFFVNGLLFNMLLSVLGVAAAQQEPIHYVPWPGFLLISGIWLLVAIAGAWQLIGIWRSADRHVQRGGRTFWAVAAKLVTILWLLQSVVVFFTQAGPQIGESYRIAIGDADIGDYRLTLRDNGTAIGLSGGIKFGITEDLKELLSTSPAVDTIYLSSHGGRLQEAESLADLIRSRGLKTFVSDLCLSACTVAFLGGQERILHSAGRLGFHEVSFAGDSRSFRQAINRRLIGKVVSFGVSPAFAERAFTTPSDTMWYPTTNELLAARFVTGVDSSPWRAGLSESFLEEFRQAPLMAVIERYEPEAFERILAAVVAARRDSSKLPAVTAEGAAAIASLPGKYLPVADDDAVFAYGHAQFMKLKALAARDKRACFAFLFSEAAGNVDVRRHFSEDDMADEMAVEYAALEQVVVSGATQPQSSSGPAQVERIGDAMFDLIAQRHRSEVLAALILLSGDDPDVAPDLGCEVALAYFGELMSLPKADVADMMRYLFAE